MPGYTKHEYDSFIIETKKQFRCYVKEIAVILPDKYDEEDIKKAILRYYPYEWRIIEERYKEYIRSDKKLQKMGKKARYKMQSPDRILLELPETKKLLSQKQKEEHRRQCSEGSLTLAANSFLHHRNKKIQARKVRIDRALERTQIVEPEFIDKLIGFYDRKNVSQKDRVYIMRELEKYYCPKVIRFFKKIAHSEINFQLRSEAVKHLLSLGHYAKLRRQKYMKIHTGNKTRRNWLRRVYAKETFEISAIPEELEYRIHNAKEQNIKSYDYFISHSSIDHIKVQQLITFLNTNGKNVYCDWISDSDYLKRHLVCDATLDVIEKRLEQSAKVLFVASQNSYASKWVKYELNYFHDLCKTIEIIDIDDIKAGMTDINHPIMEDNWYIDSEYKGIRLIQ